MARIRSGFSLDIPEVAMDDLYKPIVFVVDMINGFVREGALSDASILEIVPNIKELVKCIKPSVFICDAHDLDSREFDGYPIHCIEHTSESKVIAELAPYAKRIIYKNSTNAFHAKEFQNMLVEILSNYQDIVIVGCCSDICILQFALSLNTYLNEYNFDRQRVIVPLNMIETFHMEKEHDQMKMNEVAYNLMKANGIKIVNMR